MVLGTYHATSWGTSVLWLSSQVATHGAAYNDRNGFSPSLEAGTLM